MDSSSRGYDRSARVGESASCGRTEHKMEKGKDNLRKVSLSRTRDVFANYSISSQLHPRASEYGHRAKDANRLRSYEGNPNTRTKKVLRDENKRLQR